MSVTIDGVKFNNKPKNRRFLFALLGVFEFILTIFLVITLAANVLMPEKAMAVEGVSNILSYQGRLTDASGNTLGGTGTNYCFRFSIYDDATVGGPDNELWPSGTPSDNIVNVVNGVFNVGIGEADSLASFYFATSSGTVYLNVEAATSSGAVCGPYDNLAPRQRIDAVAYARVAYDLYGGRVRVGTGTPSGSPKLLYLDVKDTSDTIGGACSPSGTIWYNSNNTRALVCDNGTIQEIGNLGTLGGLGISGNTTGTPTTITSGTITLAGGANVTLSQQGNAITISAGTAGGGGSIGAISAGATQATSGTVIFSNSNNVSFGMDGNTITASAGAAGGGIAGIGASNTIFTNGTVVFSGGNNITVGTDNQKIIISAADQSVQTQNLHGLVVSNNTSGATTIGTSGIVSFAGTNITITANTANNSIIGFSVAAPGGGGAAIEAGTQSVSTGTVIFSDANNVSFGMAGSNTVTASASFAQSAEPRVISLNATSGSMSLVGASNVTVSNNGSAITIYGPIFSNSNNVTFGANGQTLTASASFAQSAEPRVISLNATSGSMSLVGASNVTVSNNGSAITIYGPANILNSMSIGGNTGTTGSSNITGGGFVLAASNNITLSQSNNSISIYGPTQSVQTQNLHGLVVSNSTSGATTIGTSGTVSFGGTNITITANANNSFIGFSVAAPGAAQEYNWVTLQGNIAPGANSSASGSTIAWSAGNNVTFSGTNGSIVRIDAGGGGIAGIGASNTTYNSGTVIFSAQANITINSSVNGANQYVQFSAPAAGGAPTLSRWFNFALGMGRSETSVPPTWQPIGTSNGSLFIFPLVPSGGIFPGNMTVKTFLIGMSGGHNATSASTAAKTYRVSIGLYTVSGSSTLALLNSALTTFGTGAAYNSQSASFYGPRLLSINSSVWVGGSLTLSQRDYYLGYWISSSGETFGLSWMGMGGKSGQMSGTMGVSTNATATSMGYNPFFGMLSVTTNAMPASINMNALVKTASGQLYMPYIYLENEVSKF